jgi:GNAT superfamily N-acetyltransferase
MRIAPATTEAAIRRVLPVLAELRPHHQDADAFIAQILRQQAAGYQLITVESEDAVVAAAGYRLLENLAWGRFLYLDDLVTLPANRGRGFASALMDWLLVEARRLGCAELHLDSGVHRFDAHALYHRHRLRIRSHHFSLTLTTEAD